MLARLLYDLAQAALRLLLQLWPLWLFWLAWRTANALWRGYLLTFADAAAPGYALAYQAWPSVALLGPVLLMAAALVAHRLQLASRLMPLAAIAGVALATLLTLAPEWQRLAPYLGHAPLLEVLAAVDRSLAYAAAFGFLAIALAVRVLRGDPRGRTPGPGLVRAASDNHGHADWLAMAAARRLFPGPDPAYGGLVVGEAYRVDQDRVAALPFDPARRHSWGRGGSAPLLVDPCRSGPTHALVLAGSGGFKTTSVGVPTLLAWTASAVVLDPSRELGPMLARYREQALGQRVLTLDPGDPATASYNVLDWIDTASPLAESNVEAVVSWICGEPARGRISSGAEFFKDSGKALIACILADTLWDQGLPPGQRTLRRLRQVLVTPEDELRAVLRRIHEGSASSMARDLAGTLMGLVPETFSGVYANAGRDTRWLSTPAYAALVSGDSFRTEDLCAGRLTVFVQVPLKVLQATPALGRVIIGSLLNAAYEADGELQGRILFLLDEVARLGPMAVLEQARDAGRKYGLTLLLLYQSLGQLLEQWGREGKQAWYDGTSWRLFAALADPDTARELSALCGENGVVATSHGDTAGRQGRLGGFGSASSARSASRGEIRRALIRPEELLQDSRADEAFVIARGQPPLRCGRALYFRRPEMLAAVDPSRFHKAKAAG